VTNYVWVRISYYYDDIYIVGIYASPEAGMDSFPQGWERVADDLYQLKNMTRDIGECIRRWEVIGE
jgi:hypothetical protein